MKELKFSVPKQSKNDHTYDQPTSMQSHANGINGFLNFRFREALERDAWNFLLFLLFLLQCDAEIISFTAILKIHSITRVSIKHETKKSAGSTDDSERSFNWLLWKPMNEFFNSWWAFSYVFFVFSQVDLLQTKLEVRGLGISSFVYRLINSSDYFKEGQLENSFL